MEDKINKHIVGIGSVCAQIGNAELTAYAIGSCIALCLYEAETNVGAMAHILLPSSSYSGHENNKMDVSTKYADHALDSAIEQMLKLGAHRNKIQAAIIGGAEMFPHGNTKILNIGEMNTASVKEELIKSNIPLVYSEVGGKKSRTVIFRVSGQDFIKQLTIKSPNAIS